MRITTMDDEDDDHLNHTSLLFLTKGSQVEVTSHEDHAFDAPWYVATIIHPPPPRNNLVYVEYHNLLTEDDGSFRRLREYANISYLRPSPPLSDPNPPDFQLNDVVDAFHRDGWCTGVITDVIDKSNFVVSFKNPPEEIQFGCADLRIHRKWVAGRWFQPKKQGDTDGRTTHSLIEQIEQTTPCISKQSTVASSIMKKQRQEDLDSNDNGSLPSEKPHDEVMDADLSKNPNRPSVGSSEGFESKLTGMTDQTLSKTENHSRGKKVPSKLGKGAEVKTLTVDSSKKSGELTNEPKSLQASVVEGSTADSIKTRTLEDLEEKGTKTDVNLPVVVGLQCKGLKVTQGKMLEKQSTKENPNVTESDTQQRIVSYSSLVAEKEGNEGDAASVAPKRKRGRPPKLQAVILDTQNGGVKPSALSVVEGGQKKDNKGSVHENTVLDLERKTSKTDDKKYSAKREKRIKRRTIRINTESSAQDSEDMSKEKTDSATRNPEASLGKLLDAVSDDQPLSRYLEAKHTPITVHGPEGTVEQSSEVSERSLTCYVDVKDVPFVRNMSLWKTIESLEAFQMLPQKPHFRPLLEGVKESSREGLAVGTMVTFSNLVDKTCGLRFNEPISTIEECLETLVELENNGFDVEVIRERLTQLLLIKNRHEDLAERAKGVVEKIKEHNVQGKRNDEEIEAIDRQIKELQEKRKQVVLKKEKGSSEIGSMEAMNEEIEQEMRGVGEEFDGLAAAPLLSI